MSVTTTESAPITSPMYLRRRDRRSSSRAGGGTAHPPALRRTGRSARRSGIPDLERSPPRDELLATFVGDVGLDDDTVQTGLSSHHGTRGGRESQHHGRTTPAVPRPRSASRVCRPRRRRCNTRTAPRCPARGALRRPARPRFVNRNDLVAELVDTSGDRSPVWRTLTPAVPSTSNPRNGNR